MTVLAEIKDNHTLYLYLVQFGKADQAEAYAKILPQLIFKPKSFGWVMKQGEKLYARD